MRAAIYARVSTPTQSPEHQLLALREYAERRGWGVVKEYVDVASGAKESRPALNALMQDARRRKFDCVLVWKFDRFARSVKHLVCALEEFQRIGVGFLSLTEGVDMYTPIGRAMYAIIAAMAQLERDLIAERVRSGMIAAKKAGKSLGRPKEYGDEALEKCEALRRLGLSIREIARETGVPKSSVSLYLQKKKKGADA
ncbi:MAG: recombinase family protein [bacterium JZ-2024 1]